MLIWKLNAWPRNSGRYFNALIWLEVTFKDSKAFMLCCLSVCFCMTTSDLIQRFLISDFYYVIVESGLKFVEEWSYAICPKTWQIFMFFFWIEQTYHKAFSCLGFNFLCNMNWFWPKSCKPRLNIYRHELCVVM